MTTPEGLQILYDKKGHLEDSIFYADGKTDFLYHYYPNGQLAVHYHLSYNKKESVTEAWDEEGKKIKNFVMMKEAEFKADKVPGEPILKKIPQKTLQ